MTSFRDKILAAVASNPAVNNTLQRAKKLGIVATPEFDRIKALPRRKWEEYTPPDAAAAVSRYLKTPQGTMELRPLQAAALAEAADFGGLFLGAGVSKGKTLISLLLGVAMQAQRPLLFVPASLLERTLNTSIPEYSQHWYVHPYLTVMSYDALSRDKGEAFLWAYKPDLVMGDECHRFKNRHAARTKRLVRYAKQHPETRYAWMSGSITCKSLHDYAHLMQLSCGPYGARSPLPLLPGELQEWALALDHDVDEWSRMAPGVLLDFCEPGESVREGFRRRLAETPGIILTTSSECDLPIIFTARSIPVPAPVREALVHLEGFWETPGGEILTSALELAARRSELASGFYYRWVWPLGPDGKPQINREWLEARKEWHTFVRDVVRLNRRGLDTPMQVARCVTQGHTWEHRPMGREMIAAGRVVYERWKAVEPQYTPVSEAVWIDDWLVRDVAANAGEHGAALVWVQHRAFAEALAKVTAWPHFGAGATEAEIVACAGRTVILSISSHKEGKNLPHWSRNVVVTPPPGGLEWEQMIGRTHRTGQQADEVKVQVYLHHPCLAEALMKARANARYQQEATGQPQKLLIADYGFALEELT